MPAPKVSANRRGLCTLLCSIIFLIRMTLANPVHFPWQSWGINCEGSSQCPRYDGLNGNTDLLTLQDYTDELNSHPSWFYNTGSHIACVNSTAAPANESLPLFTFRGYICIFAQPEPDAFFGIVGEQNKVKGGGVDAMTIVRKVADLVAHGCRRCGSIPLRDDNDISDGQLTSNFVSDAPCVNRLCDPDRNDWKPEAEVDNGQGFR